MRNTAPQQQKSNHKATIRAGAGADARFLRAAASMTYEGRTYQKLEDSNLLPDSTSSSY